MFAFIKYWFMVAFGTIREGSVIPLNDELIYQVLKYTRNDGSNFYIAKIHCDTWIWRDAYLPPIDTALVYIDPEDSPECHYSTPEEAQNRIDQFKIDRDARAKSQYDKQIAKVEVV